MLANLPSNWKNLTIDKYDDITDLNENLNVYITQVSLCTTDDDIFAEYSWHHWRGKSFVGSHGYPQTSWTRLTPWSLALTHSFFLPWIHILAKMWKDFFWGGFNEAISNNQLLVKIFPDRSLIVCLCSQVGKFKLANSSLPSTLLGRGRTSKARKQFLPEYPPRPRLNFKSSQMVSSRIPSLADVELHQTYLCFPPEHSPWLRVSLIELFIKKTRDYLMLQCGYNYSNYTTYVNTCYASTKLMQFLFITSSSNTSFSLGWYLKTH